MARSPRPLKLEYSPQANLDLGEIWEWNAKRNGSDHADRYVAFLKAGTVKTCRSINPGRPVPGSDVLRYALIRRRQRGYGHILVFAIDGDTFRVVRYFHTSQDWQSKLAGESRLENEPGF